MKDQEIYLYNHQKCKNIKDIIVKQMYGLQEKSVIILLMKLNGYKKH